MPFGQPLGAKGAGQIALHVADGSQILADRVGGRALTVTVDGERYGSCLARLATPSLAGGWLPILETRYAGARGTHYLQESFSVRRPDPQRLTSYVRVTASRATAIRAGTLEIRARALDIAWTPGSPPRAIDEAAYDSARAAVVAFWRTRVAGATPFVVPERRVLDAERALLVQNLELTWRYSSGNAYEEFSFPESLDGAQVAAEFGFHDVAAAIVRRSLGRRPAPYPNWKMGEKLLGAAVVYRLSRDDAFLRQLTPALRGYVNALGRALTARAVLGRERYSSDIPDSVYGLHSQTVVWQGLNAIADAWSATGNRTLAVRARGLAVRLGGGLRAALRASERRLPDGSLFVPVRLLDREPAYTALTASRDGSYWNLVAPYAFASGFLTTAEERGALRYMLAHGSRLLGLVRAGAFALYGPSAYPASGTDEVYGLNVARLLADLDQPDQLVLSLYGQLAGAMTPGTFVAGEGATVAPLDGRAFRSMYLPPNSVSNAAFLETLRLLLLHETPRGLQLAYATPRAWLTPGRRIEVRAAPTRFGPLSYTLASAQRVVHATIELPAAATAAVRIRLPAGGRITRVLLDGRPYSRFNARTETIDLPRRAGSIHLDVRHTH